MGELVGFHPSVFYRIFQQTDSCSSGKYRQRTRRRTRHILFGDPPLRESRPPTAGQPFPLLTSVSLHTSRISQHDMRSGFELLPPRTNEQLRFIISHRSLARWGIFYPHPLTHPRAATSFLWVAVPEKVRQSHHLPSFFHNTPIRFKGISF